MGLGCRVRATRARATRTRARTLLQSSAHLQPEGDALGRLLSRGERRLELGQHLVRPAAAELEGVAQTVHADVQTLDACGRQIGSELGDSLHRLAADRTVYSTCLG